MKMKDAGTDSGPGYEIATAKKHYPRLTLDLGKFPELNEVGKEVTLVIEACVVGLRDDEYGGSVDVEVQECGVKKSDENGADKELGKMTKSNLES